MSKMTRKPGEVDSADAGPGHHRALAVFVAVAAQPAVTQAQASATVPSPPCFLSARPAPRRHRRPHRTPMTVQRCRIRRLAT